MSHAICIVYGKNHTFATHSNQYNNEKELVFIGLDLYGHG